jgi:hypothetical protein
VQVAEGAAGLGEVGHRVQGVGVIIAEHLLAGGEDLFKQVVGALEVAESPADPGEEAHGPQGGGMVRAEHPHVRGVVAHAGEAFDHHRDPLQGPQVTVEPVRQGALAQGTLDLQARSGVQLGPPACPPGGAEGGTAALPPSAVPAVGVLA